MSPQSSTGRGRQSRRGRSASSRPTGFYVVLGLVALAGVAALGYVALRPTPPPPEMPPAGDLTAAGPAQGYTIGSATAPVSILEFADFECPSCERFATITEPDVRSRIIGAGKARLTYYDLPLPQHRNSYPASHAAACADEQGKFWPMHDAIYAAQYRWNTQSTDNPRSIFRELAQSAGLDIARWEACYDARKYQRRIDANAAEAGRRGVNSTPTFIINGKRHTGAMTYDGLKAAVDSAAIANPLKANSASP